MTPIFHYYICKYPQTPKNLKPITLQLQAFPIKGTQLVISLSKLLSQSSSLQVASSAITPRNFHRNPSLGPQQASQITYFSSFLHFLYILFVSVVQSSSCKTLFSISEKKHAKNNGCQSPMTDIIIYLESLSSFTHPRKHSKEKTTIIILVTAFVTMVDYKTENIFMDYCKYCQKIQRHTHSSDVSKSTQKNVKVHFLNLLFCTQLASSHI